MELPEIVEVARNFAVMVRIQGPDPKGLKMRRYAFHHHESGKTTLSASGLLLLDSLINSPILERLFGHYLQQHSSVSALVVTTASVVEPFLPVHYRDNPSQVLPKLIPGAQIDVLVERDNRIGEKLNASDDKTPHGLPAQLLALVDVPASSLALQSLLEAHGGSPEHGSWEVGWSLAPLSDSPSITGALQTKVESNNRSSVESQRCSSLDESGSPGLVAMSATRIAFLGVPALNLKDLPNITVSQANKRGDLLVVMGSPFGILSPLHFFNSISVGAVSNCCPPGSPDSSLLLSDVRCLPGMEGGPVFGKHAHLIGILTRPIRQKASGAEIQLVVTWDAISTAWSDGPQKVLKRTVGNLDGYDIKRAWSYNKTDFHGSFNYTREPPKTHCSPPFPFEKALPSIVLVTVGDGAWASGIVLNNRGLILTNAHLLEPWRFGKTHLGMDETTFLAMSTRSVCEQERSDGRKGRQWSSPSLVKTSDASVGDDHMASTLDSIKKSYKRLRVRLDHMEPRVWCDARAVYVSKGPLDIALLQLESVPNQLCPIAPHFVCPSPGSKAFVIGHGLFGPRSDLCPSVCSGVVAKVVEMERPLHLYGLGVLDTEERYLPAMLETTAAVHPGASGGAVVNSDGHMIGLVTSNAKHGGGTIIPHLNFSIPCAALRPIFNFSRDMRDVSILQAMDKPNELLSSVWALMPPPPSQRPAPFPSLPKSLMEKINKGKGSSFAKFLAENRAETSLGEQPPSVDQPIKEEFLTKILPSKI
ncbi:glyoxysomal processing protease, glyoxysomal isoform X2 [Magnolia sinica]|uniref:glyoxysomal processing protease, glyoxysomal isoform X2 n=1 Tax=Magnolia sinica TaxID=86752 RepID=UPI002657E676|nr:glyoxysomal processing protease, glyoxysomal isoform X2 [Magnolia sinica]